jgi:hypothetical protein
MFFWVWEGMRLDRDVNGQKEQRHFVRLLRYLFFASMPFHSIPYHTIPYHTITIFLVCLRVLSPFGPAVKMNPDFLHWHMKHFRISCLCLCSYSRGAVSFEKRGLYIFRLAQ